MIDACSSIDRCLRNNYIIVATPRQSPSNLTPIICHSRGWNYYLQKYDIVGNRTNASWDSPVAYLKFWASTRLFCYLGPTHPFLAFFTLPFSSPYLPTRGVNPGGCEVVTPIFWCAESWRGTGRGVEGVLPCLIRSQDIEDESNWWSLPWIVKSASTQISKQIDASASHLFPSPLSHFLPSLPPFSKGRVLPRARVLPKENDRISDLPWLCAFQKDNYFGVNVSVISIDWIMWNCRCIREHCRIYILDHQFLGQTRFECYA